MNCEGKTTLTFPPSPSRDLLFYHKVLHIKNFVGNTILPFSVTEFSKLTKTKQVISSIHGEQIANEKKFTSSTKGVGKSDLTSRCCVESYLSNEEKTFSRVHVKRGKENRFNKCDQQDTVFLKTSKVRPWLATEFSPDVVTAKKKRLMEKDLPKQSSNYLGKLKADENYLARNNKSLTSPVIVPKLLADSEQEMVSVKVNRNNGDIVLANDSVIVISDSDCNSSDVVDSSPKPQFRTPKSLSVKKKKVPRKHTIVSESSDSESGIFSRVPLNLRDPTARVKNNTSHEKKQVNLPVISTPLFQNGPLLNQSKFNDIQSWISNMPSVRDLDPVPDSNETTKVNDGLSTSTEDLLKKIYGSSLEPAKLNPCKETLKSTSPKLEHTEWYVDAF